MSTSTLEIAKKLASDETIIEVGGSVNQHNIHLDEWYKSFKSEFVEILRNSDVEHTERNAQHFLHAVNIHYSVDADKLILNAPMPARLVEFLESQMIQANS